MVRTRRARELGQNFLIDRNIVDVIERLAELRDEDVVLEIGGGEGVLSDRLAQTVAHLHVVEIDRRLEQPLAELLARRANVSLHFADALALVGATIERTPLTPDVLFAALDAADAALPRRPQAATGVS